MTRVRGPWLVALGLLPVYLLTLHHAHGWDSIAYTARSVHDPLLSERYLSSRLFHPHHLFYVPLAMLAQHVAALFAGHMVSSGEAAFTAPMVLNALLGAASAGLAGGLALRLGASPARATVAAIVSGLSNAVWRYSTEVEVMVPALFFLLLGAWLVTGRRTWGRAVQAGLAFAASIMLHQIALLFAGAATLVVGAKGTAAARRGERVVLGQACAFIAAWAVPVAACYLAVGIASAGQRTPAALLDWMLAARGRSTFATHGPVHALREVMRAGVESFVSLRALARPWYEPLPALVTGLVVLWALVVVWLALPAVVRAWREGTRPVAWRTVNLGLAITVVFIAWFQPWNDDYWVYLPPLAAALLAVVAPRGRLTAPGVLAVVVAITVLLNGALQQAPEMSERNATYADLMAFAAAAGMRPGDVFVSGGSDTPIGEGIVAFPFFAGVEVVPAYVRGDVADQALFVRDARYAMARTSRDGSGLYLTTEGATALSSVGLRIRYGAPALTVPLRGQTVWRVSWDGADDSTRAR